MGIFHDFFARNYLSIFKITWKMALSLKVPSKHFFFSTVHNLITFSIMLTNKNRGGALWAPPPPIKTKVCKPPIIARVKGLANKKKERFLKLYKIFQQNLIFCGFPYPDLHLWKLTMSSLAITLSHEFCVAWFSSRLLQN